MYDSLLDIRNICKSYHGNKTLDNVSITLRKNEIHAIIGENGAGKSTLMKIVAGIEKMDSGSIFLNNKKVNIDQPYKASQLGINISMEDPQLIPTLSVLDNICLGGFCGTKPFSRINWKNEERNADALMQRLGFRVDLNRPTSKLSFAEQKIIEIIKVLNQRTKVLILDEVTSSLSDSETACLFDVLSKSKDLGLSVLFITHRINEALHFADRVTILRDGRVIDSFSTNSIQNQNEFSVPSSIIHKMVGDELYNRYPKINNAEGEVALSTKNLSCGKYLHNVNIDVREGEIIGISGLMGSGRTATARTLFGLNKDYSGYIAVHNKPVKITSPYDALRNKICFIPENQKEGCFHNLSVSRNLTLSNMKSATTNFLIDSRLERDNAREYVRRLNIFPKNINNKLKYLSTGNKQKVLFAMSLIKHAKIFILDEPTKGLDIASKVEVYNILNEIILDNGAVIFISSDIKELMGMCDRVFVMRNGETVAELSRGDISKENIMLYATDNVSL